MSLRLRLAAVLAAALAAACTSTSAPAPGAHLAEPTAVAVFRGETIKTPGADPALVSSLNTNPYRPYLAVANAATNDLSIFDGIDDTLVESPAVVRGLVYPVPGRPVLLVAADLGDDKPDLLVVVTAGDLPWLGGTQLRVIRTWAPAGGLAPVDEGHVDPAVVELGADILALIALPPEPAAPGSVKLVAALADQRIATVTFTRRSGSTAIDLVSPQATVVTSARLGFQPLHLAAIAGDRTRVFAASSEPLPGGTLGVAQIAVAGTPVLSAELNAHAPTRLVAAGSLAEATPFDPDLGATAFAGRFAAERVYAVLDESACGFDAEIACGLVAIDVATGDLVPDPTPAGSMHGPFRAPIPLGYPLALGFSGPPARALDPQYAGSYQRVATGGFTWQTTGTLAAGSSDGFLTFVDAGRWNVPSGQAISPNVKATVAATRPGGTAGAQWLTLVTHPQDPDVGVTVVHTDASNLTTSVQVTAGYTPTDRWTVTREGVLPHLASRRAEVSGDGALALQVTSAASGVQEVVRLWDPTLGVTAGDIVVIEPNGLGTCTTFEASVVDVRQPEAGRPGGFVTIGHRTPGVPAWDRCVDLLLAAATGQGVFRTLATIRAGDYVLVRGTGAAARHVGRPAVGKRFEVAWQDEAALVSTCTLPPAKPWPGGAAPCDAACRAACDALVRARLSRRIAYVNELPAGVTGPALAFKLGLEQPTAPVPRDLALIIDTNDGRTPFRVTTTAGYPVDPRAVVPFDRSRWAPEWGIRYLVPWGGASLLDATPSISGGAPTTLH